jgi:hypothetical protein
MQDKPAYLAFVGVARERQSDDGRNHVWCAPKTSAALTSPKTLAAGRLRRSTSVPTPASRPPCRHGARGADRGEFKTGWAEDRGRHLGAAREGGAEELIGSRSALIIHRAAAEPPSGVEGLAAGREPVSSRDFWPSVITEHASDFREFCMAGAGPVKIHTTVQLPNDSAVRLAA